MNPFELTGPEFLLFFGALGAVATAAPYLVRMMTENGDPVRLSDPLEVAYLRGGPPEALRVAALALIDAGALTRDGKNLHATTRHSKADFPDKLEKDILHHFENTREASTLFELTAATEPVAERLRARGLIPDDPTRARRRLLKTAVIAVILFFAGWRVFQALAAGRSNILFLVSMAGLFFLIAWRYNPRRTVRGDRSLSALRLLLRTALNRADRLRSGHNTAELALLAAVFGTTALPAAEFGYTRELFPKADKSDWSGSSGGSSSSCGSSCGSSDSGGDGGSSGCGGCGGGGCGGGCGG